MGEIQPKLTEKVSSSQEEIKEKPQEAKAEEKSQEKLKEKEEFDPREFAQRELEENLHKGEHLGILWQIVGQAKEANLKLDFQKETIKSSLQRMLENHFEKNEIGFVNDVIDFALENGVEIEYDKPEIKKARQKYLENFFEYDPQNLSTHPEYQAMFFTGGIFWPEDFVAGLNLNKPKIVGAFQKALEAYFEKGGGGEALSGEEVDEALAWLKKHNVELNFKTKKIQEGYQKQLKGCISTLNEETVSDFFSLIKRRGVEVNLEDPEIKTVFLEGLKRHISDEWWRDYKKPTVKGIKEFAQKYNIEVDLETIYKEAFANFLSIDFVRGLDSLFRWGKKEGLTLDFKKIAGVKEFCQRNIAKRFETVKKSAYNFEPLHKILALTNEFGFSEELSNSFDQIYSHYLDRGYFEYLRSLSEISPPSKYYSFALQILKIDSSLLREKSLEQIKDFYKEEIVKTEKGAKPIYEQWEKEYRSIPADIFLQLYKQTEGDKELLAQYQELYKNLKKTQERKDLNAGIINSLDYSPEVLKIFNQKLKESKIVNLENFNQLKTIYSDLTLLKIVLGEKADLLVAKTLKPQRGFFGRFAEKAKNIFVKEKPLSLQKDLKNTISKEFGREIKLELLDQIKADWGNIDSILIYLGKMAKSGNKEVVKYLGEIISHIDPPNYEMWQAWRYDLGDEKRKKQIGCLDEDQRKNWQKTEMAEIGELTLEFSPQDKPEKIFKTLKEAIVLHEHLKSEDLALKFLEKTLKDYFGKVDFVTPSRSEKAKEAIKSLNDRMKILKETKELESDIKKLNDGWERIEKWKKSEAVKDQAREKLKEKYGGDYEAKAKTDKVIAADMAKLKPKDLAEDIKKLLEKYKLNVDSSLANFLTTRELAKQNCEAKKTDSAFKKLEEELGIKIEEIGEKDLQKIIKTLDFGRQILNLSNLSSRLIGMDQLFESKIKKEVPSLKTALAGLKHYFKETPFLQDLENVEYQLASSQETLAGKKKLAVVFTDHPYAAFNVGKYPIGCGSCQNYEGSASLNKSLAGYIGDAKTKFAFIFDLEKLPKEIQAEMAEKGFEAIKDKIKVFNILEASLAREITKIAQDEQGKPVIFLEPTYTTINKADLSMDNFFNMFFSLVGEKMKTKIARGGGEITLKQFASCSPAGEYDDSAGGQKSGDYTLKAHYLEELKPTRLDEEIARRIGDSIR